MSPLNMFNFILAEDPRPVKSKNEPVQKEGATIRPTPPEPAAAWIDSVPQERPRVR
jgi:hypothetical protein